MGVLKDTILRLGGHHRLDILLAKSRTEALNSGNCDS
jgi:hypothetical protein